MAIYSMEQSENLTAEEFEVGWGLLFQQIRTFYNLDADAQGNLYPQNFNNQIFLSRNSVLQMPLNGLADGVYNFLIFQPPENHYTLGFNSQYQWVGGIDPVVTQKNGAKDVISCVCNGSGIWCVFQGDFS